MTSVKLFVQSHQAKLLSELQPGSNRQLAKEVC